jgi:precorrin-4/cobalt-precorrin-4 C11-methyltransferase
MNPVHFVGAGPGDPELITVKGARLLAQAEVVLYAGSLVPEAILGYCPQARKVSSARMALKDQVALMVEAVRAGRRVVRLHTGDPSLYGAIQEQRELLAEAGIESLVVPGVTAALAAAARAGRELTLPEVSKTVIFTRLSGRTPTPEGESLASLAQHRATLCLYLSAGLIDRAQAELLTAYPAETPVVVAHRVGWPGERLLAATLGDLARTVRAAGLARQTVVLVGPALGQGKIPAFSKLYDPAFSHGWRTAQQDD